MDPNFDMMEEDALFPHLADDSMADPTCELDPYYGGEQHPEDYDQEEGEDY
jgi:hypothetical protein